MEFKDISSEDYREYRFGDVVVRIDAPLRLNVSSSGGHRILDSSGTSHYIPTGWQHLSWKATPPFVL
jgi:hypothetical protein